MILLADKAYVRKLRAVSDTQDKLALRLRLDKTLSRINLQPVGLPHSAILFIRRLNDPLPGVCDTGAFSSKNIVEWERAIRESVNRFFSQASRPALETIHSDAGCVMFADKAEMLACLAQDWVDERVASRWWWNTLLLESENVRATIISLWTNQPAYIPGALQHLANNNSAGAFVNKLYAHEAERLLQSVLQCFNLAKLCLALSETIITGPAKENNGVEESRFQFIESFSARLNDNAEEKSIANKNTAPWRQWVSESKSFDWRLEQQAFLGVALMIQRAPAVVRSRQFAQEVKKWRQSFSIKTQEKKQTTNLTVQTQHEEETLWQHETTQSLSVEKTSQTESHDKHRKSVGKQKKTSISFSGEVKTNDAESKKDLTRNIKARSHENRNRAIEFSQEVSASKEEKVSTACDSGRVMVANNNPPATADGSDTPFSKPKSQDKETLNKKESVSDKQEFTPLVEAQLHTQLGGVFYLINFGLFLDLYEDFTQEPSANLQLNIWDFVMLLGKRLLDEAQNQSDALWSFLALLAGRQSDENADCEFTNPFEWRIPVDWLKTFESSNVWTWGVFNNRLLVLHPGDFFVIDIPRNSQSVDQQLERELKPHKDAFSKLTSGDEENFAKYLKLQEENALQFWFERFFLYARVRLQQALGTTDTASLAELLLKKRAQVAVTTTHVDVVFSLRDLSVEIRLSGLDRNPGWIPAAGRMISFYYE